MMVNGKKYEKWEERTKDLPILKYSAVDVCLLRQSWMQSRDKKQQRSQETQRINLEGHPKYKTDKTEGRKFS